MKHNLRNRNSRPASPSSASLQSLLALLAAIGLGLYWETNAFAQASAPAAAPPKPLPIPAESAAPVAPPPAIAKPDGQQIVRESAAAMAKLPSITARMRQKVDLQGVQLAGTGNYLQLGTGENLLLRLSVKVQVDKHVTSLQQICDGRFLWLRRDMPEGVSLQRIDLKRVRESTQGSSLSSDGPWIAVGGLPRLMENLAAKYQFGPPRAAKLGTIQGWQLEGNWRTEGAPGEKPAPPAEGVPRRVVITLGQEDHFPYRIEFQRLEKKKSDEEGPTWLPLLTIEFFDIETGAAIDPLQFFYKPDNQQVIDSTDVYIRKFGGRLEQARQPTQPR